jgi:aminopeptidase C
MIKIKNIEQQGQQIHVTVDLPDAKTDDDEPYGEDFTIQFHVDAIGSRMVMYNLSTPEEALKAIVLEQARGTNKEVPNPESREEAISMYQQDVKEMELSIEDSAEIDDVLDQNMERIQQAVAARTPSEQ